MVKAPPAGVNSARPLQPCRWGRVLRSTAS